MLPVNSNKENETNVSRWKLTSGVNFFHIGRPSCCSAASSSGTSWLSALRFFPRLFGAASWVSPGGGATCGAADGGVEAGGTEAAGGGGGGVEDAGGSGGRVEVAGGGGGGVKAGGVEVAGGGGGVETGGLEVAGGGGGVVARNTGGSVEAGGVEVAGGGGGVVARDGGVEARGARKKPEVPGPATDASVCASSYIAPIFSPVSPVGAKAISAS